MMLFLEDRLWCDGILIDDLVITEHVKRAIYWSSKYS